MNGRVWIRAKTVKETIWLGMQFIQYLFTADGDFYFKLLGLEIIALSVNNASIVYLRSFFL